MGYIGMKTEKKASEAVATIVDRMFQKLMFLCAVVHLFYMMLFMYLGFRALVIFNIFSVLLYARLSTKKFHLTPNLHFF